MADVEVMEVIRTELLRRGAGVAGSPVRIVTQYWLRTGELLVEFDPETEIADRERRQQLARDAVNADTLAVRIAWGLSRNADFHETPDGIWARISVDIDGHPYAVTASGADHDEARCRLRDAIVDLFDDRKGRAASSNKETR